MASLTLRMRPNLSFYQKIVKFQNNLKSCFITASSSSSTTSSSLASSKIYYCRNIVIPSSSSSSSAAQIPSSVNKDSIFLGLEDVMMGYLFGNSKATQLAHSVWKKIVQKGDTVIDATCGNGYDTLAMLQMVADSTRKGRVYAMDVQKLALENTSSLLDQHVTPDEKELVELFAMCHSRMEDVVPDNVPVRLVAFNLGYLPGGNKKVITKSDTTLLALEAAKRILAPGGLISILVYVGHAGGREEYDTVQAFASGLPIENWICCKLEMLNRPLAPVLVVLVKR